MDCLCCADGGAGPSSDSEFLGSLCRLRSANGVEAVFPAEAGRYVLYVVAGCPFAARPWACLGFYGLTDAIRIIKCFPASYEDGWFLEAQSEGERQLTEAFPDAAVDSCPQGMHHIKQLYEKVNPDFKGAISVPLLWDTVKDTAVSNASLGLAEMIATQMRPLATKNQEVQLFPSRVDEPKLYKEHDAVVKMLHAHVTTAVYKIHGIMDGRQHDKLVDDYYATLDDLQDRIAKQGPYLMGESIRFADIILFISLIRLDLAYQWRFGLGRKNVREDYPILLTYMKRILALDGVGDTVLPRDIMALYFLTLKWVQADKGRTLPQVPSAWEERCGVDGCKF